MRTYHQFTYSAFLCIALTAAAIVGFTPIIMTAIGFPILTLLALIVIFPRLSEFLNGRNSLLFICITLYLIWGFLYKFLSISDGFGTIILHMQFFFCILLMLLIPTTLSSHHWLKILAVILLVVCLNILDNIRLCNIYPEIASAVNRSMEMTELIGKRINIGGSTWYNGVFFFFMVCFFAFLNVERKIYRYILLGCAILAGLFIFGYCLKASVILFTVMSAVLLYFAKRSGNNTTYMIVLFVIFSIVYLVVETYSDEIINFILSYINDKRLAIRLVALVDTENENAEIGVSTVEARVNLWMLSLKTWLDNPVTFLLGIGDHSPSYRIDGLGIGHHSDFFDIPARYGLIGLLLMYKILRLSCKRILSFFDKKYHFQLYIIFGIFILFGFSKAVFNPSVGCPLFLLLPLSSVLLRGKNKVLHKIN